jgi:hypothetical protein
MAITSSRQPHCVLSTCERAAMQPGHQKRLSNARVNDQAVPVMSLVLSHAIT